MKYFKAFALIYALAACVHYACHKEENLIPPPTIEGHWVNFVPSHPDWQYNFDRNLLTQYIVDFGDTLFTQEYTYAVRNDTLLIGGNGANLPRILMVKFWSDQITEIHNITPGVQLAPVLYLRKMPD